MESSPSMVVPSSDALPTVYLFHCKTMDGYIFKILIELLHNVIKTACFEIGRSGIKLRMMDSNRKTLVDLFMESTNFNRYFISPTLDTGTIHVGLNLNHFYKMVRCIKKKDQLLLFIEDGRSRDLGIQIIPKDFSRVTISYIKIQNIQNLDIVLPETMEHSILVSSAEFNKMCKDMLHMSNTVVISQQDHRIKFACNVGNIYSREVILGEPLSNEILNIPMDASQIQFTEEYDTEQLIRILKISGLHSNLVVYCSQGLPIMFSSRIGNLGHLRIYVKSKKQVEELLIS